MKIFYIILLTAIFTTSHFSQNQRKEDLSKIRLNSELINKTSNEKLTFMPKRLPSNIQKLESGKEQFKIIPIPPADSSNSKFELLPNSNPKDFKAKLLNKKEVKK